MARAVEAGPMTTQRDAMRRLGVELGWRKEAVCAAYVEAEARGVVARLRNKKGLSAERYADALWRDGVAKGWLHGSR